jgi:signal transduction histidine kinase
MRRRGRPRLVAGIVGLGLGYWVISLVGEAVQYTGGIEVAWLPVGLAAAVLYLGDLRWFVGASLADLLLGAGTPIPLHFGELWSLTTLATLSNTVEFTLAAVLMRRWLGPRNGLDRPADVAWLLLALSIGTAFSAICGTLFNVWAGNTTWHEFPSAVRTWWLGDTSGGLLIAPLILVWAQRPALPRWQTRGAIEAALIIGAVVALNLAVFSSHHPVTYLVFPALVLAAIHLGQRGTTLALLLAVLVAVIMTAGNQGPFIERSINDEALSTQLYILIATGTTLVLGAAVTARRRAALALAEARLREDQRGAAERERIARDLHDSVSQTLFTLGLHAGIAKHELDIAKTTPALDAAVHEVAELAHSALQEMRASIFELRGEAVAEQGLVAALRAHAAAVSVRHDVAVDVDGPAERLALDRETEETLFRIGQEAITNAVKHSGSDTVSATIAQAGDQVTLTVRDDGRGFDPRQSYPCHMGLELMRARGEGAGAATSIHSAPGSGTTVRITVPARPAPAVRAWESPAPLAPQAAPPEFAS